MNQELQQLDLLRIEDRLSALKKIYQAAETSGNLPESGDEVNNHVHTCYSFSPYNPTQAAFMAWKAGLRAVGIMDHDSFAGAAEMVEACKILGLGSTCGVELRVNTHGTAMEGRSLNNPGSSGTFYMAMHGIPLHQAERVAEFLKPITRARTERNKRQVEQLNQILKEQKMEPLDFQRDVANHSMLSQGGSVTERHILAALARLIIRSCGKGQGVINFLSSLEVPLSEKIEGFLTDLDNPHYLYDLLGILKGQFLPRFFIQPDHSECIPAKTAVDFAIEIGAIPAYAYLGDIEESVTGDKKAEKFEDSFLDELMDTLRVIGYQAVTFMPPRNSLKQLQRLMGLCDAHGFMQISGVDINSSRQSFSCPEVLLPEFAHLNRSTWALIAHEKLSTVTPGTGLFGTDTLAPPGESLEQRIEIYAAFGESLDLHRLDPQNIKTLTGDKE